MTNEHHNLTPTAMFPLDFSNEESAEQALRDVLKQSHGPQLFRRVLTEHRIDTSFSNMKYKEIAPLYGLEPSLELRDIQTFRLYRSRIPTSLFKSIVQDMDVLLVQYGPPAVHRTEEATSRFLSPVFNRLVAAFGFGFRNLPETYIKGSVTTRGRIEYYFLAFGSISVLCVEVKLRIGGIDERLDAVAQVIAECEACDSNNRSEGFLIPVRGILCDGEVFQFFLFDGRDESVTFKRGTLPGDPPEFRRGFALGDFTTAETSRPFLRALRQVCEIAFDLLLSSYISSLDAYHSRSAQKGRQERNRKSTGEWEQALGFARGAQGKFRAADVEHPNQSPTQTIQDAMDALRSSVNLIPSIYRTKLIMMDWIDEEVEKMAFWNSGCVIQETRRNGSRCPLGCIIKNKYFSPS